MRGILATIRRHTVPTAAAFLSALLVAGGATAADMRADDATAERNAAARVNLIAAHKAEMEKLADEAVEAQRLAVKIAKREQKRADRRSFKRKLRNERKLAQKRAEQARNAGFASGSAAGYASGKDEGYVEGSVEGYLEGTENGLTQGSDDLVCSDDPDVYWLPPCY